MWAVAVGAVVLCCAGRYSSRLAGFAAFKNHLSYLPFSGSVLPGLAAELEGYSGTKSALHFPVDRPLPEALVKKLVSLRLSEIRRVG